MGVGETVNLAETAIVGQRCTADTRRETIEYPTYGQAQCGFDCSLIYSNAERIHAE